MRKQKGLGSHARRGSGRRKKPRVRKKTHIDSWDWVNIKLGEFFKEKVPAFFHSFRPDKKYIILSCAALAAVLLIVLSALDISADKNDYKYYMTQAADYYGEGDYDGALSFLRKAAAINKKDECVLMMADCYEAQGNISKAVELLQKLKSNERSILRRIAELEKQRAEMMSEEKVALGDMRLDPDEKNLSLDGMGIKNGDMETVASFRLLTKLSLRDNEISDISALSGLSGLVSLDLGDNQVEDISALKNLKLLKSLNLDNNPVEDISPLKELKSLKTLSIRGMEINKGELIELGEAMPGCAIFSGEAPESPAYINLGGICFTSDITELDLSGRELTDISVLSNCRSLRRLNLSNNSISDLYAIMNNPDLKYLNISDNLVTDLRPIMSLTHLQSVIADNNRISSTAALGGMSSLVELSLSDNPVGDFSAIAKLSSLQRLSLNNTGLRDEELQYIENLPYMSFLAIEDNPELSGEAVDMLQIKLHCLVNHSPLVYSAEIAGQKVKGNTRELDLSSMDLSDISELGKLSFLESLDLSDNAISNIYIFQYTDSRETLKYLDLSGNEIEDITPLASLPNLESLDLSDNKLNSVKPLMNLTKLRMLKLGGNRLTEEQLWVLKETLKGCEIVTD